MVSAYAEAKGRQITTILADLRAKDDPEAHELAKEFCARNGITDLIEIHMLAWSMQGYGNRRAKRARKTGK